MKVSLPRKRAILALHRWLGILSAVFLLSVSLTGLALNHTEALGLNDVKIRTPWILDRYGMANAEGIRSVRIHKSDTISYLDGQIYLNTEPFLEGTEVVGVLDEGAFSVIATRSGIVLIAREGNQLIEEIDGTRLPFERLVTVGRDPGGQPVLETEEGLWQPDEAWLGFMPYSGTWTPIPQEAVELDSDAKKRILAHFQGEGMTLYRVILDLHSGRLFGWGGRTLMDLTAVAILILVSSGIAGWLRQSRLFRLK